MLSPFFHFQVHISCGLEGAQISPCKPSLLRLWILLPSEPECKTVHWCASGWDVETGEKKNVSRGREVFLRHLCWVHDPTVVPRRCWNRVRDLTDVIVKTHTYPVAYGGFSDVWSCRLQNEQLPSERVAVKAIRPVVTSEEEYQVKKKAVEQELRVWLELSHEHILPLFGITHGFGRFPAFVCPWADNGTLSEYLKNFETRLDMKNRISLLGDIAVGLQYLHSRNVVHGDLSGANVLVDENGRACLSDFGLSTLVEQISDTTVSGFAFPGNIRWAAPELFDECRMDDGSASQLSSQQADIYSFGRIMLQILTGKLPFHGIQRDAQILILILRGHQPPREPRWDGKAIPDALWRFVEACWESPSERPSSKDVVSFVKEQITRV